MPSSDDLPATLAPLARRNALEMADGPRWQYDVSRLVNLLERIRAGESHPEPAPPLESEAFTAEAAGRGRQGPRRRRGRVPRPHEPPRRRPRVAAPHRSPPPGSTAGCSAFRRCRRAPAVPGARRPGRHGGGGGGDWHGGSGGHGPGHGPGGRRPGGLSDAPRWLVALAGLGDRGGARAGARRRVPAGRRRVGGRGQRGPSTPGIAADASRHDDDRHTADRRRPACLPMPRPTRPQALARDPKTIRRGACKFANTEHAGGVATINCDYNDPKHGRTLMHLDRFIDAQHLRSDLQAAGPGEVAAAAALPIPNSRQPRRCGRTHWRGEGPWSHETRGGVMGPVSGRYACYQAAGAVRPRQEDAADRCERLDVLRDRVDGHPANMFVKAEQQSGVHAGSRPSTTSGTTSSADVSGAEHPARA